MRVLFWLALFLLSGATAANANPLLNAIGSIVAGTQAFAASSALGAALVRLGAGIVLSSLARAMRPKPRDPGLQTRTTLSGGTNPEWIILGHYATAGVLAAPRLTHGASHEYLTHVIALAGAPGHGLLRVAINGEWVGLGTTPHPDYGAPVQGKYLGKAWVKFYDGTQTAADPMMLAKYGNHPDFPWSADMIGNGICYAIVTCKYDRELFAGFPQLRFELSGIPLYDPRKDASLGGVGTHVLSDPTTWEVSENPAVQIYNIMLGIPLPGGDRWGGGLAQADLPLANWVAAMNACDAPVTLAAGGTEPQYRAGFEARVNEEPASVIEDLLKACSGEMADIGGMWKIRAGAPALPTLVVTDDDIIITADQSFAPFTGLENTHNGITASHPDPDALWEAHAAPPRYNAAWEAEDQGRRLVADLSLSAVPYPLQVQRLMEAWISDERRWRRHELTLPPMALQLEPLDVISWTSARNGYSAKAFEVGAVVDAPRSLMQRVSLREVDPADYSWSPTQELPASSITPTNTLPAPVAVARWTVQGVSIADAQGTARRPALSLRWDPTITAQGLQWEIRVSGSTTLAASGTVLDLTGGEVVVSEGVLPGQSYEARARLVSDHPTAWTGWIGAIAPDVRLGSSDLGAGAVTAPALATDVNQMINNAAQSATADKTAAQTAAVAAQAAETNANAAVTAAQAARDAALASETNAAQSASAAAASATQASTYASNASTSASNAATSETNAAGSAASAASDAAVVASAKGTIIKLTSDPDFDNPTETVSWYGSGELPTPITSYADRQVVAGTDTVVGGKELVIHDRADIFMRKAFPLDRTRRYRLRLRMKADAQADVANARLYLGVRALLGDYTDVPTYPAWNGGTTWTNPNLYRGAAKVTPPLNQWVEYVGEFWGSEVRQDAVYIRPFIFANYGSPWNTVNGNIQRFSHFSLEDITAEYNAAQSASAAATSASNAAASETAAGQSASAAQTEATNAATSASNAATSASNAATSETNAAGSAASAASATSAAAQSATDAGNSATAASNSASAAQTSATNAAQSASAAQSSATQAATDAANAATSASQASTSESNAAGSAAQAATSATNAANSATSAGNSATAASNSASTASTKASQAATSASAAQSSATQAASSASAASVSETNAAASATNASGSAAAAQSAKEVAVKSIGQGVSPDPVFSTWGGSGSPNGYALAVSQGSATKNTANAKYGVAIDFTTANPPTIENPWIGLYGNAFDGTSVSAVLATFEFELVSGAWQGSFQAYWVPTGTGGTQAGVDVAISAHLLSQTGVVQRAEVMFERPANFVPGTGPTIIRVWYSPASLSGDGRGYNKTRLHYFDWKPVYKSAWTSIVQSAIKTVDDIKASALAFRAKAGIAGAELELVALSNPTGNPTSTARISADNILLDGSVRAKKMTIDDYLDINAITGAFRVGKQSAIDFVNDGMYIGRTNDGGGVLGFGFHAGRVSGGVEEYIQHTKANGLRIKNASFFIGAGAAQSSTYSSSQTVTIPAGTQLLTLEIVGGGGGGGNGQYVNQTLDGPNGPAVTVTLKNGATTIATWTANGGVGGAGGGKPAKPGWTGVQTSPLTPLGDGGPGGAGAYIGGGKGSAPTIGINGSPGDAGQYIKIQDYDVSTLSNPTLVLTFGTRATDYWWGPGAPNAGGVRVQSKKNVDIPAGPVGLKPSATGTFTVNAYTAGSFPALTPTRGMWVVDDCPNGWQIDPGDGTIIRTTPYGVTFVASNTPTWGTTHSQTLTLRYWFWPM